MQSSFRAVLSNNKKQSAMKRTFKVSLLLAVVCIPLLAVAQVPPAKFGYLSYNEIFKAMPEYAASQQKLAELKAKYDQEAQRGEEEFQRKFAEFLQGEKDFPENILLKRQHELQDLLAKSIAFKEEAQKLLSQAGKVLQVDVVLLRNAAIRAVGLER